MYCRPALMAGVNWRVKPTLPVNVLRWRAWTAVEYPVLFPYNPPSTRFQRGFSCLVKLPVTWYNCTTPKRMPPSETDFETPAVSALRCPLQPKFAPKDVAHALSCLISMKQPYGSQNMGTKFLVTVYSGPIQPVTPICALI